ncbi:MAG: ribbon-helix-helix domain-containing protein [Candidatus Obscuribacterales bacterium]|jgi:metal-responsive CopG/Arc/MetJ family transcriptional regulator|nr:ribbon-helix-helix domain-containing protein [Candidatus Obscuribacterales bacterium]
MTREVSRTKTKRILVAFKEAMLDDFDKIAKHKYMSRSELLRESMRFYMECFRAGRSIASSVDLTVPSGVLSVGNNAEVLA